jgi:Xaa-Pro aminopeptidase
MRELETAMKKVRRCGFEENYVSVARFKRGKKLFSSTSFIGVRGSVEFFRRSKDEAELKKILRAHAITEELLRRIPSSLRVNISERALAWKIETWARELGADGMSFATIVAFGKHTSRPHHRPTDKKLKKGDIVQIDLGATYKGYCSDRSVVLFTAHPTVEQQRIYDALMEAKNTAIDAVKIGASTRELDRIARNVLKRHKLDQYFTHSLGHGVGIDIHEGVTLSQRGADDHLMEYEVITIEPGVYIPGKFGMRLEDMMIVE